MAVILGGSPPAVQPPPLPAWQPESHGLWTWQQFNNAVDALCPLECTRIFGQMCAASTTLWPRADGSSIYYRNQIRQAVLDLCNFIPEYTKNHETIYYPQDFVPDGMAGVGALPPFSEFKSAWYYDVNEQKRYPVVLVPWESRFDLTTRKTHDTLNCSYTVLTAAAQDALAMAQTISLMNGSRELAGLLAISPKHDQFYCFPQVINQWVLSLFWDGHKLDYRDQELVPFQEEAAYAVSLWVQAKFAEYVERDLNLSADRMRQYASKRSNLYTRTKDKSP